MAWTILVEDHQRYISAKLYRNPSSGEDLCLSFLYRYIEKQALPPGGLFSDESRRFEQSLYKVTKETFLQNYIEISAMVSDKIFIFLFYTNMYGGHVFDESRWLLERSW